MSTLAELKTRDHFVYRAFDASGRLLYVGCSLNVEARLREHKYGSRWHSMMARHTVEGPYSYDAARAIEWEAIQTENPSHNGQTPRALAERRERSDFFDSVMNAAMAAGEHWTVACTQARIATDLEFPTEAVA